MALALLSVAFVLFGMKCYLCMRGVWLLWKSSGSFGGTGHGGIDIDLEYCWAVAGVTISH